MLNFARTAPARLLLASVTLIALTAGCAVQQEAEKNQAEKAARDDAGGRSDLHSFAKPHEIAVDHLSLDIAVDFDERQVAGRASLRLVHHAPADIAWFDVRDLDIESVYLDDSTTPVEFKLTKEVEMHGQGLKVPVTADTEWVHIDYSSSPDAAALQWLEPRQTSGDYPFLLSQGQAILTRSWVPCQDSPGVRMTYDATVKVPQGMMALMSATNPTELNPDGVYTFKMEQPIPSYLMAIAVGQLEFRALDDRTGVYAEPSVIEKAAWEIAETPTMLERAEELYGPYRWERYDVIFLPSSFPFGGMENPRLTFATPTILAGDRSLVALIAHELAHSWSGNLVTNATWDDFWLNEGFTVYFERRIMEALSGRAYSEMLSLIGEQDLEGTLADLDPRDQHLYLDLAGRDPDDGMTDVAYDKGYLFLRMLEEHFGRERWDRFLRDYFDRFAFKPMTTDTFIDHLKSELAIDDAVASELQLDAWIFGPGIPSNRPDIQSDAFSQVDAELARWVGGTPATSLNTDDWVSHQWQHFLRSLPEGVGQDKLAELDAAFGFSASGNSEVLNDWLVQAIRNDYEPAYPALDKFLTGMGRRKFLKPLYTELAKTEEGLARAKEIYSRARSGYHSVSTGTIDGILNKP